MALKVLGCFQERDKGATSLNIIHVLERHAPSIPEMVLAYSVASGRPLRRRIFVRDKEAVDAKRTLGMVPAVIGAEHKMRAEKRGVACLVKVTEERLGPRPCLLQLFIEWLCRIHAGVALELGSHLYLRAAWWEGAQARSSPEAKGK